MRPAVACCFNAAASPGTISSSTPVESRCTFEPSNKHVSVDRPTWGWGRTSKPCPVKKFRRTRFVQENEPPEHAPSCRRQHPFDLDAAKLAFARRCHHFNRTGAKVIRNRGRYKEFHQTCKRVNASNMLHNGRNSSRFTLRQVKCIFRRQAVSKSTLP